MLTQTALPATSTITQQFLQVQANRLPKQVQLVAMDIAAYDLVAAQNYLNWQLAYLDGGEDRRRRKPRKRSW